MKRISIYLLSAAMLGLGFSQSAFAMKGDTSVNAGVGFGTSYGGRGTGIGFSAGAGYEILNNTQVRGDFALYHYSYDFGFGGATLNRLMFSVGGRQYIPLQHKLKAYGQAGLLLAVNSTSGASSSNIGIDPALGVEYAVTPKISVGAKATYYIVSGSFFALQATAGYHF